MTRLRVLLATVGTRGDVEPFVALAVALRDAGHDLAVCTCPRFADVADAWLFPPRCTRDPGFRTAAAHLAHQLNAENGTRNAVHAIETIARQG